MFVTNGVGKGSAFIANIMMARMLGIEIYGEFIYVSSVILILSIIPKFGFDQSMVMFIPKNEVENRQSLNVELATLSIYVSIGIGLTIIGIFLSNPEFFAEKLLGKLKYAKQLTFQLPIILGLSLVFVVAGIFQAKKQMKVFSLIINFGRFGLFMIAIPFFIFFKVESFWVPILSLYFSLGGTIVVSIWLAFRKGYLGALCIKNIIEYQRYIRSSFPFMLIGSTGIIVNRLNVYMVGYYLNDKSVAIFSSASQIALIVSFMLVAVNQVFAPMISKLYYSHQLKRLTVLYKQINVSLAGISICIILLIFGFKKIIMGLFGVGYAEGATALVIIAGGHLFNALSGPCGYMLNMTGHNKVNLYINIIMLFVVYLFNLILIPIMGLGYIGAAISSAFTLVISNALRMFFLYRLIGVTPIGL